MAVPPGVGVTALKIAETIQPPAAEAADREKKGK